MECTATVLITDRNEFFDLFGNSRFVIPNLIWNPEKLLILLELLDSIFRWNDEFLFVFHILGHAAAWE